MNRKQEIAFDVDIFRNLFSNATSDNIPEVNLAEIYLMLAKYHELSINDKWLEDIKDLKTKTADHNIVNYFEQLFMRSDKIQYNKYITTEVIDDYIFEIASLIPNKILVSDNSRTNKYKIKPYSKERFLDNKYECDCSLYRIPKNYVYKSNTEIKDFKFLSFFLKESSIIEFIDPFLLKPKFSSVLDFVYSILYQIKKEAEVRFYYDLDNTTPKAYNDFKGELIKSFPLIKVLEPEKYNNRSNHDRFVIVNEKVFSIRFTSSFNNLRRISGGFKVNKNFEIIIDTGRKYEDLRLQIESK